MKMNEETIMCKGDSNMKKPMIVTKTLDELGRILIPLQIRRTLDIKSGDKFEVYLDEEEVSITLKKIMEEK